MAFVSGGGVNVLQKITRYTWEKIRLFLLGSNVKGSRDDGKICRLLRATKWYIWFCR
jgi:hypothetical protein